MLRRQLIVCAAIGGVLLGAGVALAADVGANDDTGKYAPDGGAAFYQRMASVGLGQTVITVRWRPSDPLAIAEESLLDRTVPVAQAAGLRVVFAVYPYPPREIESGFARPAAFASWLDRLARRYPTVRQFVIGNEPNQPAFFRPQFTRKGVQRSAARFGQFLAAGYDALKAVDPTLTVVGIGLSPRGNDRPGARSNVSTSPVRFLAALGVWYRSSGRDRPLMDGLSFHPYPNQATDPLERGYPWPNAGFVNLDRIKQSIWDAFADTPQPTTLDGLRLYLDEVGWQVDTSEHEGYEGVENVSVTTETRQAEIYGDLVKRASCDPDIAEVNVFGFFDDPVRTGFQAALHRVDGTPRSAVETVQAALAGPCPLVQRSWVPRRGVALARRPKLRRVPLGVEVELAAGEGAAVVVCAVRGRPSLGSLRVRLAVADELTPGCAATRITSSIRPVRVTLPDVGRPVTVAARLVAETNPSRVSVVSRPLG